MTGDRDRGVTPVVGKAMEAAVIVLFAALVTALLYGHVVPGYRGAAADAVADRVVAEAAYEVEGAVPPDAAAVDVAVRASLPATIGGDAYVVRGDGRTLVLDHPDDGLDRRVRLGLPDRVDRVSGTWHSGRPVVVRVGGPRGALVVTLSGGERP